MSSSVIENPIDNPLGFEKTLTHSICQALNTPRSLTVSLLIREGEWRQLKDLTLRYNDYHDIGNFADDYLASNLLRKSRNLPGSDETALKDEAIRRFYTAELRCKETNEKFLSDNWCPPSWWHRFERELRRILGPVADVTREIRIRNGKGASIGVRGFGMVSSDKFDYKPTVTKDLLPFYEAIVGETISDYRPKAVPVKGNTFFSVPKDSDTERGACTEPTVNMMLQLHIGNVLRQRLQKFGVDLRTQAWNQALAEMAFEWRLATVDLSQASDLMAWGFLLRCLPLEWFHLLSLASCRFTEMPSGDSVELEKFCSMGNGFTFPLQSAVYLAFVNTFTRREDRCVTAVYGDDMIVPQSVCEDLIDALDYSGFKVNTRKSCLAGSFFESCGADYFLGRNVRPFFLRQDPEAPNVPIIVVSINNLRRWSYRRLGHIGCDARLKSIWLSLKDMVPDPWTCRVPWSLGDSGILSGSKELGKKKLDTKNPTWEGEIVRAVVMQPEELDKRTFGVLLATLMNSGDGHDQELVPLWDRILECPRLSKLRGRADNGIYLGRPTYGIEPRRGFLREIRTGWTHIVDRGPDLAWI
jgi:hypothetical protein